MLNVPADATIAELDVISTDMASILASMSDATLTKIRYKWKVTVDDPGIAFTSNAVVNAGVFIFLDDEDVTAGLVAVPAIKEELFVTDGPFAGMRIDTELPAVQDFILGIEDLQVCNLFGVLFSTLETAYRQSRT